MSFGYEAISGIYDKINADIDYSAWGNFVEACFDRYLAHRPELLLDLACGTGSMTLELARRGYDMIGVDRSPDMLSVAYERKYDEDGEMSILYLCQDMRTFELYGTVGAVTCCLDSVNYLVGESDLEKCFACVHNYLDPDGLFIFDVNTPYKFKNIYADNSYILESEDEEGRMSYCGWQNEFDSETGICNFYLSVFSEDDDGRYSRSDEMQTERCYDRDELIKALKKCGFETLDVFGGFDFSEPDETCERWYIVARAKK